MNRREFIRISSMGLGGFALANPMMSWLADSAANSKLGTGFLSSRTPTYCEVCFWKCAGWVHKKEDGTIWKITGNENDPHCNGRLCPRGTGGVGMYYDEDRLKTPLIRRTKGGEQVFEKVSWDEALTFIAERMKAIAAEHGSETVLPFSRTDPVVNF